MKNLSDIVLTLGERPVSAGEVLFAAIGLSLVLLALMLETVPHPESSRRPRACGPSRPRARRNGRANSTTRLPNSTASRPK